MSLERKFQLLEEICKNPCRTNKKILDQVIKNKTCKAEARGNTSELFAKFLVKRIPEVISVRPFHRPVGKAIDRDLKVDFVNIEKVFIQVKTSDKQAQSFMRKLRNFEKERGTKLRIAVLSAERTFDEIIQDFVDQVNVLEGRSVLTSVKFSIDRPQTRKRKSY